MNLDIDLPLLYEGYNYPDYVIDDDDNDIYDEKEHSTNGN